MCILIAVLLGILLVVLFVAHLREMAAHKETRHELQQATERADRLLLSSTREKPPQPPLDTLRGMEMHFRQLRDSVNLMAAKLDFIKQELKQTRKSQEWSREAQVRIEEIQQQFIESLLGEDGA